MTKEFPIVDLSDSDQLYHMGKRSQQVRKAFKSQMSTAYDDVLEAMGKFIACVDKS